MWTINFKALLLYALLLMFCLTGYCRAAVLERSFLFPPAVRTKNGTIQGIHDPEYNQDYFLGIPFAQPPIGKLRFSRPQPINTTWETRYLADSYGPFCLGNTLNLIGFSQLSITYPEDEDCLTLNVVRPSNNSFQPAELPVLVWIHGGGFQEGGSGDARYNMSHLVKISVDMGMPVIGVSINYRLGPFGFISGRPFRERGMTNLGLHDQRRALLWVKENIAAFGGDPLRVTVQGESAGALSIGLHLVANNGRDEGLFHGAIVQSGGPFFHVPFASDKTQDSMLEDLANATGCALDGALHSCFRSVPAAELQKASSRTTWNPIIDSDLILDLPSVALSNGNFNRVPLLIGANTNEGTPFVPLFSTIGAQTVNDFNNALLAHSSANLSSEAQTRFQDMYLNRNKTIEQQYLGTVLSDPGEPYGPLYGTISLLLGDLTMIAGRRIAAEAWARFGVTSYSYRFDTVPAGISPQILGAAHFQEIPFVFHNTNGDGFERNPFGISDLATKNKYLNLSELMSRMWISFVNTASPNNHRVPNTTVFWPKYNITEPRNIVFNAEKGLTVEVDDFRSDAISFIRDIASHVNR